MSEETGYRETPEADKKKAKVFFDKGRTVAQAGQYDFAISMYLSGLTLDPDAVEFHQELREIALKRKVSGGKDIGMFDKMKLRYGKDDLANMILAEKFLAFDPGNTGRMLEMLQHAVKSECFNTVMWIGPILMRANTELNKPEYGKYIALKDAYIRMRQWQHATEAAQRALQMKPNDMDLQSEVKNLGAQQTMDAGGYSKGGSFRDSIRDLEGQVKLMQGDTDSRSMDVLSQQIAAARGELKADPNEAGKITKLVDALVKTEKPEYENEAINVLESAYERTGAFRFRLRVGQIKMQQLKRMQRSMLEQLNKNPKDAELIKNYNQFAVEKTEEELKEFHLAAENYPTDTSYKYEAARRLFMLKRYPEAIPLLQQSVQDPKLRTEATIELGRAFLEAEYVDEAVDTLKGLSEAYQLQGDAKSKEIFYWLGRSLEKRGDAPDAIKCFSKVTMWDFNYRDVQLRIKSLRTAKA